MQDSRKFEQGEPDIAVEIIIFWLPKEQVSFLYFLRFGDSQDGTYIYIDIYRYVTVIIITSALYCVCKNRKLHVYGGESSVAARSLIVMVPRVLHRSSIMSLIRFEMIKG